MSIAVGKLGIVRLKGAHLTQLRVDCFNRDQERCVDCGKRVAWHLFHMSHIVGRGRGGSDVLENVRVLCSHCHLVNEHNPKSVPAKELS